jgi:hypothetical protein
MIVRIIGEGQLRIAESHLDELNVFDDEIQAALEQGDERAFRVALAALLDRVRAVGAPLAPDALEPSDLVLPPADAHVDDVRALLREDGLIPG